MERLLYHDLLKWRSSSTRMPMILRGARQVGKTHLVRSFGKTFPRFVEINFERLPDASQVFEKALNPVTMIRDLGLIAKQDIIPGQTLLFLDEIQSVPRAITALRYFYEEMPELHVIAAGSLLDFAIEQVGVPVGRVEYRFMYPMSFIEFLVARGYKQLARAITAHDISIPIEEPAHSLALELWGEYIAIGGMPRVVQHWINEQKIHECQKELQKILNTYSEDFGKYAKNTQIKYLDVLFKKIPRLLSQKFNYSQISTTFRKRELEPALYLLHKAGLVHFVYHSHGNGVPMGAESEFARFKLVFLDCGLAQAVNGADLKDWFLNKEKAFVNKGEITESFVGQELMAYSNPAYKQDLYYWHRQKSSSSAEVDYLISQQNQVVPVEVKSGRGSQLLSLRQFLDCRPKSSYGIRFSTHDFSVHDALHSYPIYAVANVCQPAWGGFLD